MHSRRILTLALVGTASLPILAWAAPTPTPTPDAIALAAKFGAREGIDAMTLSPDGKRIAMVVPYGDGQQILVASFGAGDTFHSIMTSPKPSQRIVQCQWATNNRLLCNIIVHEEINAIKSAYSRMVAMDGDGHNLAAVTAPVRYRERAGGFAWNGGSVIDWTGATPGQVLMTRDFVREENTGTRTAQTGEGLGVESVNVTTLARTTVEAPHELTDAYITDGLGHVRVMAVAAPSNTGYASGVVDYLYRKAGSRGWNPLARLDQSNGSIKGFVAEAVDPGMDAVIGFDEKPDGRRGLFSIRLDGSGTRTLLLGRDDVDVDGLITIGRQKRVVGASYVTDRRRTAFFDPALKQLRVALGQALPNAPQISFLDASADENSLLLIAQSDTDPGIVYRFDKTTHSLEKVQPLRPELEGVTLAPMTAVSFPARDGTMIPGYLTLPATGPRTGLPAIVMPHGGPSARDEWGFDWLVQYFAARGFAVLQPNYRGSSGYGTEWSHANAFKSWSLAIGDIDDAGRWLLSKGIAGPGHLAIVGWSYGGYAALQSGVTDPGLFKAIVAVAPVTDLDSLRDERMRFTSGAVADAEIGHGDYVAAGSPARHAERIAVPVLLFHGDQDINVDVGESRMMADRLRHHGKTVDYVEFKGLDHQLDSAAARTTLLSQSDAFLRSALGL